MSRQVRAFARAVALICGSAFAVYPSFVQLDMTDPVTHRTFRAVSEEDYRLALAGQAPFPYQWRTLGPWTVRAGERVTGADPHAVDVVVKVVALVLSGWALGSFAARSVGSALALGSVGVYLAATAGAYASQGYSIYYTSDYLMLAGWFWSVNFLRSGRVGFATATTLAAAWAKETLVLVPILAGVMWLRRRQGFRILLVITAAFLLSTMTLRVLYPAPLAAWAWWAMVKKNVPLLDLDRTAFMLSLRNNLKVLLFYNVGWWLAARAAVRSREPFIQDLAVTLAIYLALAYVVVYIRELRHMLPLAILIIPLTLRELHAGLSGS